MSLNFYDYPVPDSKAPVEEILLVLHKYGIPTVMTKEVFRSVEEKQKMFDDLYKPQYRCPIEANNCNLANVQMDQKKREIQEIVEDMASYLVENVSYKDWGLILYMLNCSLAEVSKSCK